MSRFFPELSTRRTRGRIICPLTLDPLIEDFTPLHFWDVIAYAPWWLHGLGKDTLSESGEMGHSLEVSCYHQKVSLRLNIEIHYSCG